MKSAVCSEYHRAGYPGVSGSSVSMMPLIGGGGGSRTRVRKHAYERPYRLSPTCCFAPAVKVERNRLRLVRLISPRAPGPRALWPAHIDDALSDRHGRATGRAGYLTVS